MLKLIKIGNKKFFLHFFGPYTAEVLTMFPVCLSDMLKYEADTCSSSFSMTLKKNTGIPDNGLFSSFVSEVS